MTSPEFPHVPAVDSPQAISALPKEKIRMEAQRYQGGSLSLKKRKSLPDVWVFRYYAEENGRSVYKRKIIGTEFIRVFESAAKAAKTAKNSWFACFAALAFLGVAPAEAQSIARYSLESVVDILFVGSCRSMTRPPTAGNCPSGTSRSRPLRTSICSLPAPRAPSTRCIRCAKALSNPAGSTA